MSTQTYWFSVTHLPSQTRGISFIHSNRQHYHNRQGELAAFIVTDNIYHYRQGELVTFIVKENFSHIFAKYQNFSSRYFLFKFLQGFHLVQHILNFNYFYFKNN